MRVFCRMTPCLELHQIGFARGKQTILQNCSLQIFPGERIALIGKNGVGKTTLLYLIAGLLPAASGHILYRLRDKQRISTAQEAHSDIGFLPDIPPLYPNETVQNYLKICADLRRMQGVDARLEEVLDLCDLKNVRHRRIRNLSKGYRQRLGIAQAILHRPHLILMDEPSNGLDPAQLAMMNRVMCGLPSECSLLFSSHLLPEVARLCHRFYQLENKTLRAHSLPAPRGEHFWLHSPQADRVAELIPAAKIIINGRCIAIPYDEHHPMQEHLALLLQHHIPIEAVRHDYPLEELLHARA